MYDFLTGTLSSHVLRTILSATSLVNTELITYPSPRAKDLF